MSHTTIEGSLKEAHRHMIRAMTDAKMAGHADLAADIEQARLMIQRIRDRYKTGHPNARMIGACKPIQHGA